MNNTIIEALVKDVFQKAEIHCSSNNKSALSKHISEEIEDYFGEKLANRNLMRLYDKFISKNKSSPKNVRNSTIKLLCNYLGFDDYKDYVDSKHKKSFDQAQDLSKTIKRETFENYIFKEENKISNNVKKQPKKRLLKKEIVSICIIGALTIIVLGLFLKQYTSPFNMSLHLSKKPDLELQSDYPELSRKAKASLKIYLPSGIKEKEISNKNDILITDIPYNFLEKKVKIELKDKYWKTSKDSIIIGKGVVFCSIEPNELLAEITGDVLAHIGGFPIENALVRIENIETTTNSFGMFTLKIPVEKRKLQYELTISKNGYKTHKKIHIAGTTTQIRLHNLK